MRGGTGIAGRLIARLPRAHRSCRRSFDHNQLVEVPTEGAERDLLLLRLLPTRLTRGGEQQFDG
jgi:hypothetical protein